MKKTAVPVLFVLLLIVSLCHAAESARQYKGSGEVTTVDPVYSQITLSHGVIKGFAHDGVSEFYVSSPDLLKGIAKGDLVDFNLIDTKGDVKIDKLIKTGEAPPKEDGIPIGQAVHDALQGTGDVLQAVTSPVPPLSEAVGAAGDSTADTADLRIQDGEVKQKLATF